MRAAGREASDINREAPVKVTLLAPSAHQVYRNIKRSTKRQPTLGPAYLAASLASEGHEVRCIDADALDWTGRVAAQGILEGDPELVGISVNTALFGEAMAVAQELRKAGWEGHLTLGGVHPSALPRETLERIHEADSLVIGEGERTVTELACALQARRDVEGIAGLLARTTNGDVVLGAPRSVEKDLDTLPLPALELLPMDRYVSPMWTGGKERRMGVLITSRGCPAGCEFCASNVLWGRRVRFHSVDRVMQEVRRLVDEFNVDYLVFNDDTFTINKRFCLEICNRLEVDGVRTPYMVTSRVDTVDEKLLDRLRETGCFLITYGIESGSEEVLRQIRKNTKLDRARRAVEYAKQIGMKVTGNFMFGHWTDTRETCRRTLAFARELQCDLSQFAICIPYPGSALYHKAAADDRIHPTADYSDFGYYGNAPWSHPTLSQAELLAFQEEAYSLT